MSQRFLVFAQNAYGDVVPVQKHTQEEFSKRKVLAIAKFRTGCPTFDRIDESKLPELIAAAKSGDNWATFCVDDILAADSNKLEAFRMIFRELTKIDHHVATGADLHEATFPKSGCGVPWGHDRAEIAERFPSTTSILYSRSYGR